jgi:hypothetical protein
MIGISHTALATNRRTKRFRPMRIVVLVLSLTGVASGIAAAQQAAPYVYTPPPQQPVAPRPIVPRATPVGIPFGGLYNVLSGAQPSRKGPQPLTPFNAAPATP